MLWERGDVLMQEEKYIRVLFLVEMACGRIFGISHIFTLRFRLPIYIFFLYCSLPFVTKSWVFLYKLL